jgi:RND superfamily putative drug exporter
MNPQSRPLGYRAGRQCARHPWLVIAIWLGLLAGAILGHRALGGVYSDDFSLAGTSAQQGANLLRAHHLAAAAGGGSQLVFTAGHGGLAADRAAVERAVAGARRLPDVLAVTDPLRPATTSRDGSTAYATVYFSVNPQTLGPGYLASVGQAVAPARAAGVQVDYGGQLGQADRPRARDGRSELIGVLAALVILVIGFGSGYAAGLPVLSALLGVFTGLAVLGMLAAATTFATVSPTLAAMMGLGVGIDYALFLTTRHRQLVMDGADPADAAAAALASSGPAVLVAALTVVIALLGLYASGLTFIGKLGLAGGVTVAVAAIAALTLVPALLGLAGRNIDRLRVGRPAAESAAGHAGWQRYAERLGGHPWRYLAAGLAVLAILAIPVFSMRLGHVDAGADPASYTDRQAYDALRAGFGPGANGPFTVVARLRPATGGGGSSSGGGGSSSGGGSGGGSSSSSSGAGQAQRRALGAAFQAVLQRTPDVAAVSPVRATPDGAALVAVITPRSSPQAAGTDQLMHALLDQPLPASLARFVSARYVTGLLAAQLQFRDQVASRLPVIIGTVIAAAFVLLLLTFRSPVLALKAAVLNLLSIGAAYGVIVAVFQWGWGGSLFGVSEPVPIESYVPMMMFAIVFGLSMDYEVFLLSRVREAWLRRPDNHASVAHGLAVTARVISCAALIMTSVFLAFLLSGNVVVKMLALGLGVSVLVDASVIRLVIVPATMFLLGRYNWWVPGWLDRVLPGPGARPGGPAAALAAAPPGGHPGQGADPGYGAAPSVPAAPQTGPRR